MFMFIYHDQSWLDIFYSGDLGDGKYMSCIEEMIYIVRQLICLILSSKKNIYIYMRFDIFRRSKLICFRS